ncbi:replication initiator protein A [Neobacillus drentensis]|uniref:replication initiator protein A n=1 Tax=Neobacillus drentensis TaxID=220684 RepID=UPI001F18B6BB|nr:replication initiator protein A [Neobacillus drentensis]
MKDKFIKIPKNIYNHSEIRELDGDYIFYYCWLLDFLQYSKKNPDYQENGLPYVIFTEEEALKFCNIKKGKLYRIKPKLRSLGLIDYKEQRSKKQGVSTPIFVTEFDLWEKNKQYLINKNSGNKVKQPIESVHGFGSRETVGSMYETKTVKIAKVI